MENLFDPLTLLYYWPYGRYGINFHPPLAGQLNLATYAIFGHWMKDIPARRMATVIEFALTITIGFHFLARRYGVWVGLVMAGSLLLMPRLYGQAHLIDTDTPGLLLWAATALAFWKGLHEPRARRWRIAVGILLGLAFVEKLGAVVVLVPLLLWLIAGHLLRTRSGVAGASPTGSMVFSRPGRCWLRWRWHSSRSRSCNSGSRLPMSTDLFVDRPASDWSGAILAVPLGVWLLRRLLGRLFPRSRLWGTERPALETWTAILAFAPVVGWLGNPAWWRETLPRLAHYYTLSNQRRGALPDIQIIYFGQVYEYSLPWHNAWVLMGITVPGGDPGRGCDRALLGARTDPQGQAAALLPDPPDDVAGDPHVRYASARRSSALSAGVLFPGRVCRLGSDLAGRCRWPEWPACAPGVLRLAVSGVVVGSAAVALVGIHPYELSYYNELIGGPRGAWARGFELSYWYDAFNPPGDPRAERQAAARGRGRLLEPEDQCHHLPGTAEPGSASPGYHSDRAPDRSVSVRAGY